MTAEICPAITAANPDEFRRQIERVCTTAVRLHLDVSDGILTPAKSISIDEIWWPGGVRADIHVMYKNPFAHTALLLNLRPQLIIVHAEADGDFAAFAAAAHAHGVEVGVALQQQTNPEILKPALHLIDHVMVFSGTLGYFGGTADLSLLEKVTKLKAMKPQLEIGWDGGINVDNARAIAEGGVEVLNSGGFIQKAADPCRAYEDLTAALQRKS